MHRPYVSFLDEYSKRIDEIHGILACIDTHIECKLVLLQYYFDFRHEMYRVKYFVT